MNKLWYYLLGVAVMALVTYIDAPCPECGGRMVERMSRKGRRFYGCEHYPECDFTSWDRPLNIKCPVCGGCTDASSTSPYCKSKCILFGMNFTDVENGTWYTDAVEYVYHRGMMQGVGADLFDVYGNTSRAMLVTVLWRLEGEPAADGGSFVDVADGKWYTEAIRWASANGIVEGYGNGKFGPEDKITREQMVTILYRYANYKKYDVKVTDGANILSFKDAVNVSAWAKDAMLWAVDFDIIKGIEKSRVMTLSPSDNASRAQMATFLYRFCENTIK